MLEGARGPREVEAAQVGGDRVHVDGPEADPAHEQLVGAQPVRVEVLEPARPLRPRSPSSPRRRRTRAAGRWRRRRTPRRRRAPPAAPGRRRTRGRSAPAPACPLVQRLGDEEPLPHLAVEHDVAAVVPHRPQPLRPGAQGGGAQRLGRAQLRAQHDRATSAGVAAYMRSKLRASSQSVTWRLLAAHSCSAVFRRWWCTSGPNASSRHGRAAQLVDRLDQGGGDAGHVGRPRRRCGRRGRRARARGRCRRGRPRWPPPARDTGSRPPPGSATPPGVPPRGPTSRKPQVRLSSPHTAAVGAQLPGT